MLEAFRLGDAAERRDLAPAQKIQFAPFPREHVLEVERTVHTFDDGGLGIQPGNPLAEFGGLAVAFGDENRLGAREVRWRLAQGAARQQMFVAERLLAVNQHHVVPPPAQIPILETVVEQQGVATEFFDRITSALHAVLVHEHDHVLEIGREHVRFVAGHLRIEQQGFAVRHHARRGLVLAQQDFVEQPLVKRLGLGTITARKNGDIAAGVAQFAGEFFHDRGFARAADGQVADGDDLHPQGLVAQDAHVVKPAADFDGDLEQFRAAE